MDRRQRKTRVAIVTAFIALLSEKPYHAITVGEIIARADVGRATFYAHFETKDFLLKELCAELFGHIADTAAKTESEGDAATCGLAGGSVFLHLLRHLKENDRHTLALLSSQNNEIFLQYFRSELKTLVGSRLCELGLRQEPGLDEGFLINHIAASFVETVAWWLRRGMKETPIELASYFEGVVGHFLKP